MLWFENFFDVLLSSCDNIVACLELISTGSHAIIHIKFLVGGTLNMWVNVANVQGLRK